MKVVLLLSVMTELIFLSGSVMGCRRGGIDTTRLIPIPHPPLNPCKKDGWHDRDFTIFKSSKLHLVKALGWFRKGEGAGESMTVLCDTKTLGGGWIVFQRRGIIHEKFNREWDRYKFGFGDIKYDYWMGLEDVSRMTKDSKCSMVILLVAKGIWYYQEYKDFFIGPERSSYGNFTLIYHHRVVHGPPIYDALEFSQGQSFATYDHGREKDCAKRSGGGWWFTDGPFFCTRCILNSDLDPKNPIHWKWGAGPQAWLQSVSYSQMMFRCRDQQ